MVHLAINHMWMFMTVVMVKIGKDIVSDRKVVSSSFCTLPVVLYPKKLLWSSRKSFSCKEAVFFSSSHYVEDNVIAVAAQAAERTPPPVTWQHCLPTDNETDFSGQLLFFSPPCYVRCSIYYIYKIGLDLSLDTSVLRNYWTDFSQRCLIRFVHSRRVTFLKKKPTFLPFPSQ